VGRRFSRLLKEEQPFPDLVLIDGGKGQLAAAGDALSALDIREQPMIGLAKRLEEIYLPGDSEPHNLPKTSSALKLLQHIRDEAHRFAITYHRQIRHKRTLRSLLDEIDGIGPTRRAALLAHFGTVKAIKQAKVDDLVRVEGIPRAVAETIVQFFQERQQAQDS
ncbi:excinuclease ABC subunit C, partial [candidate division KSB1 bacterium]